MRRLAALDVDGIADVGEGVWDVRLRFVCFSGSLDDEAIGSCGREGVRDERLGFVCFSLSLDVAAIGFVVGDGVRDAGLGFSVFSGSLDFECSLYNFIICSHISSGSGNFCARGVRFQPDQMRCCSVVSVEGLGAKDSSNAPRRGAPWALSCSCSWNCWPAFCKRVCSAACNSSARRRKTRQERQCSM